MLRLPSHTGDASGGLEAGSRGNAAWEPHELCLKMRSPGPATSLEQRHAHQNSGLTLPAPFTLLEAVEVLH